MKINLTAKGKEQELLLKFLEERANETLADKINNGVTIEKDGKSLINKKDLDGFMEYATKQAREQAEKGAMSAVVEGEIILGWLFHYFEEDSIEGVLYNLDGSKYTPPKKEYKPTSTPITTPKPPVKKVEPQLSLFDMLSPSEKKEEPVIKDEIFDEDEPSQEDINDAMEELNKEEVVEKPKVNTFYTKYQDVQKQYPSAVITYRLGDFYEILGDNAQTVANSLGLTLTSRDCGLDERVPMCGFPYHCAENYISKIQKLHDIVIVENENQIEFKAKESPKHWIDDYTYADSDGVMHELPKPTTEAPKFLLELFDNKIIAR